MRHILTLIAPLLAPLTASNAAEPISHGTRSMPRIIYNGDGFNFLTLGDDLGVKDLRACLSRLRGSYRVGGGCKPEVNFSKQPTFFTAGK
ncbi:MAG: hypothetical protein HZC54_03355 [Verrucomicrobia bacterium]|nr:hypothetical protein [Verrucomicrobiota bacterium]